MEVSKGKGRKSNLIIQTWERCKSLGRNSKKTSRIVRSLTPKSKSWPRLHPSMVEDDEKNSRKERQVAPEGCFTVYVGAQKQRFVIKTEYANHPLFKILLEEAESEYGYNSEGPLELPCNVDLFYKMLMAIDEDLSQETNPRGCGFSSSSAYCRRKPARMIAMNQF